MKTYYTEDLFVKVNKTTKKDFEVIDELRKKHHMSFSGMDEKEKRSMWFNGHIAYSFPWKFAEELLVKLPHLEVLVGNTSD